MFDDIVLDTMIRGMGNLIPGVFGRYQQTSGALDDALVIVAGLALGLAAIGLLLLGVGLIL
jgi:hypothetical protein